MRRAFGCGVRWTSTSWGGKGIVRRRFGSPCWVCRCRCLGARSVPVLPCGQCPCWCSRSLACSDGSRDCMTSCHAATSRRSRTPRYRGDGCGRNSARRRRGVDDLPLTDTTSDRMARRSAPRTLRERVGRRPGEQIVVRSRRCRRRVSESSGDLRRRPARRTQWHCPKFGGSDSGASVRRRPRAWGGGWVRVGV